MVGEKDTARTYYAGGVGAGSKEAPAPAAGAPEPRHIAEYLTDALPELAGLAERAGFDITCYLLKMAEEEARQQVEAVGADRPG